MLNFHGHQGYFQLLCEHAEECSKERWLLPNLSESVSKRGLAIDITLDHIYRGGNRLSGGYPLTRSQLDY